MYSIHVPLKLTGNHRRFSTQYIKTIAEVSESANCKQGRNIAIVISHIHF